MKHWFTAITVFLLMFLLVNAVTACFNPTDSFAFEVLLNKPGISYNLTPLKKAENINIKDGVIIYRSHHNGEVAVILQEIKNPLEGLSIRLQVPTKFVKVSHAQTTIEVKSDNQLKMNGEVLKFLKSLGYEVESKTDEDHLKAILKKENVNIAIWSVKADEIHSGMHIVITNGTSAELMDELKKIALSLGISEEEWNNKGIKTKIAENIDLQALHDHLKDFDFKTAIKVELKWLKDNGIVSGLSDSDIEQISKLAKAGLAGHNSRLVWAAGRAAGSPTTKPEILYCLKELAVGVFLLKTFLMARWSCSRKAKIKAIWFPMS